MAEEPIKPNPPVDTAALIAEVEALRKSKAELLDDYKKAKILKAINYYSFCNQFLSLQLNKVKQIFYFF